MDQSGGCCECDEIITSDSIADMIDTIISVMLNNVYISDAAESS